MILTTTPSIENRTIGDYLGIVTGEAILGANIFKDLFAGIRDIVGGRSASVRGRAAQGARDRPQRARQPGDPARRQRGGRHRHRLRDGRARAAHADGHRVGDGGQVSPDRAIRLSAAGSWSTVSG